MGASQRGGGVECRRAVLWGTSEANGSLRGGSAGGSTFGAMPAPTGGSEAQRVEFPILA